MNVLFKQMARGGGWVIVSDDCDANNILISEQVSRGLPKGTDDCSDSLVSHLEELLI